MNQKTILVVDDNEFDRSLLERTLRTQGAMRILQASTAEECMEQLLAHQTDLVLLDVMMPGNTDGELLRKIREMKNAIELPVIMVTSKRATEDVVMFLRNGANDFVSKPINLEILVSRAQAHLRIADLSRSDAKLKQMAALEAMVTTYNHEINNPLTIAILQLEQLNMGDNKNVIQIREALWRIAEIVKKIRALSGKKEIEFEGDKAGHFKHIKLG